MTSTRRPRSRADVGFVEVFSHSQKKAVLKTHNSPRISPREDDEIRNLLRCHWSLRRRGIDSIPRFLRNIRAGNYESFVILARQSRACDISHQRDFLADIFARFMIPERSAYAIGRDRDDAAGVRCRPDQHG